LSSYERRRGEALITLNRSISKCCALFVSPCDCPRYITGLRLYWRRGSFRSTPKLPTTLCDHNHPPAQAVRSERLEQARPLLAFSSSSPVYGSEWRKRCDGSWHN